MAEESSNNETPKTPDLSGFSSTDLVDEIYKRADYLGEIHKKILLTIPTYADPQSAKTEERVSEEGVIVPEKEDLPDVKTPVVLGELIDRVKRGELSPVERKLLREIGEDKVAPKEKAPGPVAQVAEEKKPEPIPEITTGDELVDLINKKKQEMYGPFKTPINSSEETHADTQNESEIWERKQEEQNKKINDMWDKVKVRDEERAKSSLPDVRETVSEKPPLPDAREYVKAIVKKNFQGKLPKGAVVEGSTVSGLANGFYDHGPNADMKLTPLEIDVESLQGRIYHNQEKLSDLMQSEIVTISTPTDRPGNRSVGFFFFQDRKQADSRGYFTLAHAQIELPSSAAFMFITEIGRNPDLLEAFYQGAFKDLDSKGEGQPGARRTKLKNFYLLSGTDQEDVKKTKESYNDVDKIKDFFKNLEPYTFKNGPYGTGDAFTPR